MMTPEQIIKLLDAGYTKADIDKMITPAPAADIINSSTTEAAPADSPVTAGPISEATPEPEKAEDKPEPEKAEDKPDPLDDIKSQIAQLTATVNTITKTVISPTLENIKPLGAEDVIIKFFKEVK